jgi:hypothetical protein
MEASKIAFTRVSERDNLLEPSPSINGVPQLIKDEDTIVVVNNDHFIELPGVPSSAVDGLYGFHQEGGRAERYKVEMPTVDNVPVTPDVERVDGKVGVKITQNDMPDGDGAHFSREYHAEVDDTVARQSAGEEGRRNLLVDGDIVSKSDPALPVNFPVNPTINGQAVRMPAEGSSTTFARDGLNHYQADIPMSDGSVWRLEFTTPKYRAGDGASILDPDGMTPEIYLNLGSQTILNRIDNDNEPNGFHQEIDTYHLDTAQTVIYKLKIQGDADIAVEMDSESGEHERDVVISLKPDSPTLDTKINKEDIRVSADNKRHIVTAVAPNEVENNTAHIVVWKSDVETGEESQDEMNLVARDGLTLEGTPFGGDIEISGQPLQQAIEDEAAAREAAVDLKLDKDVFVNGSGEASRDSQIVNAVNVAPTAEGMSINARYTDLEDAENPDRRNFEAAVRGTNGIAVTLTPAGFTADIEISGGELEGQIQAEALARNQAIADETALRTQADDNLQQAVDVEQAAREQADQLMAQEIAAIPVLPALPAGDGEYKLVISGGVASWENI